MNEISTILNKQGYLIEDSFFEDELIQNILNALVVGFQKDRVINVNTDGIKLKTINGDELLSSIPQITTIYNKIKMILLKSFPLLVDLKDKTIGISANLIEGTHDNFRMHFDRNQLTVVIYLNTLNCLPLSIFPNVRVDVKNISEKPKFSLSDKTSVDIFPLQGRTIIFYGNRTYHGVVNKEGAFLNVKRYTLQFAFDFDYFEYGNEPYYGKTDKIIND
jgi:hypothetical protein